MSRVTTDRPYAAMEHAARAKAHGELARDGQISPLEGVDRVLSEMAAFADVVDQSPWGPEEVFDLMAGMFAAMLAARDALACSPLGRARRISAGDLLGLLAMMHAPGKGKQYDA